MKEEKSHILSRIFASVSYYEVIEYSNFGETPFGSIPNLNGSSFNSPMANGRQEHRQRRKQHNRRHPRSVDNNFQIKTSAPTTVVLLPRLQLLLVSTTLWN
jgi:hypothetical protein